MMHIHAHKAAATRRKFLAARLGYPRSGLSRSDFVQLAHRIISPRCRIRSQTGIIADIEQAARQARIISSCSS
jgi:hypothetical protein